MLLIRFDERGCGLSEWDVEDFSFEAWVRDLEAVVDAAGPASSTNRHATHRALGHFSPCHAGSGHSAGASASTRGDPPGGTLNATTTASNGTSLRLRTKWG